MICSYCVRPKVNYLSGGRVFCTCGGTLDLSIHQAVEEMFHDNGRPITPPPAPAAPPAIENFNFSGRVFDNYRNARRWALTRFTRILGNETFECAKCQCLRPAATMMRFADNDALVQTVLTDWCGICVKDEIKAICPTKGDFKRVWAMLKDGVIMPESMLNSSEYTKPPQTTNLTVYNQHRASAVSGEPEKPRVKYERPRKPEGPPPEIDLVF